MARDGVTGKVKHEKKHVEWYGAIFENDGTRDTLTQKIGVHKCTGEDFAKFYKMAEQSNKMFETYRDELFCLDNLDINGVQINKKLYGSTWVQENRSFGLIFIPCIPEQITEKNKDKEDEMCLADYKNQTSLDARW